MKKVKLFSDGSCLKNPGVGGWAYMIEFEGQIKKQSGSEPGTTNNRMELIAAINGLKALKEPCAVELFTDSQYVQKGISQWLEIWVAKKFKEVKNVDLWQEMLKLTQIHQISAKWVKGHAGHTQNEECDQMARAAALECEDRVENPIKDPKLAEFTRILGYKFSDEELLREALTHKSVKGSYNNERLEFLGDAVLDLVVGEYLYNKMRTVHNEGDLSRLRAALVNEGSLAKVAKRVNLGEYLFLAFQENKNGGREKPSLLADALEAVMGAVYLESGLEKVKKIFINLLEQEYDVISLEAVSKDYKTALQELTQSRFGQTPTYELVGHSGPDHKLVFEMSVFLGGKEYARGKGSSKKEAEQQAAAAALAELKK